MAGKMARVTCSSFRPRIVYRWDRIMHQELKWRMIKRKRKLLILQRDTTREIFSSRQSNLPVVSFVEDREDVEERASREEANQAGTTSWQAAVLKVDCERGRGADIKRETAEATSSLIVIWRLAPASRMLPQPVILILSSSRRFRAENGRNHGKINELKLARRNTPRRIKRQRRTPPRGRGEMATTSIKGRGQQYRPWERLTFNDSPVKKKEKEREEKKKGAKEEKRWEREREREGEIREERRDSRIQTNPLGWFN